MHTSIAGSMCFTCSRLFKSKRNGGGTQQRAMCSQPHRCLQTVVNSRTGVMVQIMQSFWSPQVSTGPLLDVVGDDVGLADGEVVGDKAIDGDTVGDAVGDVVGDCVGDVVGLVVGDDVGEAVGDCDGNDVGEAVGLAVGDVVGDVKGDCVGEVVGEVVGVPNSGPPPVSNVGLVVGLVVGDCVGEVVGDGAHSGSVTLQMHSMPAGFPVHVAGTFSQGGPPMPVST